MDSLRPVIGGELDVAIVAGEDLVPKDTSLFGKKSSDPFVELWVGTQKLGKTKTIKKNLNPEWNESFKLNVNARDADRLSGQALTLKVFDYNLLSSPDSMGEVAVPLARLMDGLVLDEHLPVQNCAGCSDAAGTLHVKISMQLRRAICLARGETIALDPRATLSMGLAWDPLWGEVPIDLDASCVCVGLRGELLMEESVYFANVRNPSGSIRHSGDETSGEADGDDEVIEVELAKLPPKVLAFFFLATVCSEPRTFADVKETRMRLVDCRTGTELCRYMPASKGAHTALFMCRICRQGSGWVLNQIGECDHTARDFGSLVPEIKAYMADLLPNIVVCQDERVALLRKGGNVRLSDYFAGVNSAPLVFGLGWDITGGSAIDLDASVIVMNADTSVLDIVYFKQLKSKDGAITHTGDNLTGAGDGDDEQIIMELGKVNPAASYLALVINSYSGQELDDVSNASCHLFDARTKRDVAAYKLTGTRILDKKTALFLALLYRTLPTAAAPAGEWALRIVSEPGLSKTAHTFAGTVHQWMKAHPPPALPAIPPGGARTLVRTPTASAAMIAAHPSGRVIAPGSPPLTPAEVDAKLVVLKNLVADGKLTQPECDTQKSALLARQGTPGGASSSSLVPGIPVVLAQPIAEQAPVAASQMAMPTIEALSID